MNTKAGISILDMCRTCMAMFSKTKRKIDKKKQSIHEVPIGCSKNTSIMELLQLVQPQIKVETMDNLPTIMCSNCIKKLLVSYEFIEMYKNVDEKFRKMLKESNIANKCFDELEESLEFIQEEDHINEAIDKETDIHEITKCEFEIEQLNIDGFVKEEENESEWPEFEDEPLQELSDSPESNEPFFLNPYSDASDNEWAPHQSCQPSKKNVTQMRNSDYKIIDGAINSTSVKMPKRKISKKRKENEEVPLPVENSDGSVHCQQCESVFDNVKLWQKHMRQHRLEKLPKRKYTKESNKPKKSQSNQKDYECEHCGKGFARSTCYKIHMRIHTGEEPYLCIECGKSFKNASSLHTHMLRHKGEKTIQCSHCPKKFVCSSGLYGHMMVHTKEKTHVCDICGSAFHMAYQLRKHNLYHNGIKNYQCEYCDMRFVTREKQLRHMRTHTGEKPYRCKYCERAFAQSNDCVKHLRQHLGDNVYQCELCPLRFPMARDLRAHFATHKDDDEETRSRNLKARIEEERNLQIKFGCKETLQN